MSAFSLFLHMAFPLGCTRTAYEQSLPLPVKVQPYQMKALSLWLNIYCLLIDRISKSNHTGVSTLTSQLVVLFSPNRHFLEMWITISSANDRKTGYIFPGWLWKRKIRLQVCKTLKEINHSHSFMYLRKSYCATIVWLALHLALGVLGVYKRNRIWQMPLIL